MERHGGGLCGLGQRQRRIPQRPHPALLYGDPAKARFSDRDWTLDLGEAAADGVLHVISEATERYSSRTAYLVRDGVLYCVHIVGDPDGTAEAEETLERALGAFEEEPE